MEEKQNNHENFFSEVWGSVKPIVADLTASLIVIIAVYVLGYIAALFPIDQKLKDSIHLLETIFVTCALALTSLRTLIRLSFATFGEAKKFRRKINGENRKETAQEVEEDVQIQPDENEYKKNVQKLLTPKTANFDAANSIGKSASSETATKVKAK